MILICGEEEFPLGINTSAVTVGGSTAAPVGPKIL
jgi:hypothetical protein